MEQKLIISPLKRGISAETSTLGGGEVGHSQDAPPSVPGCPAGEEAASKNTRHTEVLAANTEDILRGVLHLQRGDRDDAATVTRLSQLRVPGGPFVMSSGQVGLLRAIFPIWSSVLYFLWQRSVLDSSGSQQIGVPCHQQGGRRPL